MNEEQLNHLQAEWNEGVFSSSELRANISRRLHHQRRARHRLKVTAGVFGVTATVATFALIPREAEGAKVQAMLSALRGATSMQVTTYIYRPDHIWKANITTQVGTLLRVQSRMGTNFERTWILRDGKDWMLDPTRKLAFCEPTMNNERGSQSGLEYAQEFTRLGADGPRQSHIVDGPSLNGRPTYRIIYDRAVDHYHSEILVDKETNLPIRDAIRDNMQSVDDEYVFNQKIAPDLFDPKADSNYRVLDLEKETSEWAMQFLHPIHGIESKNESSNIWRVETNHVGSIFILSSTSRLGGEASTIPTSVTDDLGRTYLKVRDFSPGNTFAGSWVANHLRIHGQFPLVSVFVPLEPCSPAHTVSIQLGKEGDEEQVIPDVQPTFFAGQLPEYATILRLDDYHESVELQVQMTRANYFEKKKDFVKAALWYGEVADLSMRHLSRSRAQVFLKSQVQCLREAHLDEQAKSIQKLIDQFDPIDPNAHKTLDAPIPF